LIINENSQPKEKYQTFGTTEKLTWGNSAELGESQ